MVGLKDMSRPSNPTLTDRIQASNRRYNECACDLVSRCLGMSRYLNNNPPCRINSLSRSSFKHNNNNPLLLECPQGGNQTLNVLSNYFEKQISEQRKLTSV